MYKNCKLHVQKALLKRKSLSLESLFNKLHVMTTNQIIFNYRETDKTFLSLGYDFLMKQFYIFNGRR